MRACCHGRMVNDASAEILTPEFNYLGWTSLLSHQYFIESSTLIFFFDYDKIVYNIFCLTLHMIRGYQVSFSVKTSQKKTLSKHHKQAR